MADFDMDLKLEVIYVKWHYARLKPRLRELAFDLISFVAEVSTLADFDMDLNLEVIYKMRLCKNKFSPTKVGAFN
ncbi:hypothetical protein [Clostridium ihumii]|uniref:hypothetical protein n=1 Tax=Clostridium ihumii TaxID=1470356 RepID=UPI003D33623F